MLTLEKNKQFDERKKEWLVQKFGLRRHQRFDVIQAEPPFLLLSQWSSARTMLRTYTMLDKRPWESDGIFVIPVISVLNRLHRCLWGEGRGWPHVTSKALQQQILAETCPINRLFTASGSRGTKLPYWRTRDVLGQPKRRKNAILNDVSSLFVLSQYVLWSPVIALILDWENSWHFVTPPLASLRKDV